MLEIVLADKDSSLESALEDDWVNPIKEVNHSWCNLIQMERDDFSLAIPSEEAFQVNHLLAKPHVAGALDGDDDSMHLNSESLENCLNVGGTLCSTVHYDQRNCGIFDADAEQVGKQALKYEFMLEEPEGNENLHVTCNLSCDCSDYLLENSFDYSSNSEATVINMEYASQIQCTAGSVDVVKPNHIATLDHTTAPDSTKVHNHDASDSTFCRNTALEAQKWHKHEELFFDQENLTGLGSVANLVENAFLTDENDDNDMILIPGNEMLESFLSSPVCLPHSAAENDLPYEDVQVAVSQGAREISRTDDSIMNVKRLRKPTRRYIEETSEIKQRCSYDRLRMSLISSKEKFLHARAGGKHRFSRAAQLYQDYPSRLHSLRGCRRKPCKQLGKDSKGYILPSESAKNSSFQDPKQKDDASDQSVIRNPKRRKHHRQWTLSEVVKLVDGVSQHGVGRWTEIKRLFFSTSAYRTAVDLKDKWRNLLRASVADPANRNLVEPQRKQASAPIPQSILQRVRDLSNIHPYPRSHKSSITDLPIVIPPTLRSK